MAGATRTTLDPAGVGVGRRRPDLGGARRELRITLCLGALVLTLATPLWVHAGDFPPWEQVVGSSAPTPAGFGDSENSAVLATTVSADRFWVTTQNAATGCEVWSSSDGDAWVQENADGFGDAANQYCPSMAEFSGELYVGSVVGGVIRNTTRIWRRTDGSSWSQCNVDGFGDPDNADPDALVVFDGSLYVSVTNFAAGVEIWRTDDGATWTQVNQNGFGDATNGSVLAMAPSDGLLYAATANDVTGTQLWRSDDGLTWSRANVDGFGNPENAAGWSMAVFNGSMFVGTGTVAGSEIWRSDDGLTWSQAASGGFGDPFNWVVLSMTNLPNRLLAGTWNIFTGGEVWASVDGQNWEQASEDGFGGSVNDGIETMTTFGENVYASLSSLDACEVWRLPIMIFADSFETGTTGPWSH